MEHLHQILRETYEFDLTANDWALLYIDGSEIVSASSTGGGIHNVSGTTSLTKDQAYAFNLYWGDKFGSQNLLFKWKGGSQASLRETFGKMYSVSGVTSVANIGKSTISFYDDSGSFLNFRNKTNEILSYIYGGKVFTGNSADSLSNASGQLIFGTGGKLEPADILNSARVIIDNDGRIGVGNMDPGYKFDMDVTQNDLIEVSASGGGTGAFPIMSVDGLRVRHPQRDESWIAGTTCVTMLKIDSDLIASTNTANSADTVINSHGIHINVSTTAAGTQNAWGQKIGLTGADNGYGLHIDVNNNSGYGLFVANGGGGFADSACAHFHTTYPVQISPNASHTSDGWGLWGIDHSGSPKLEIGYRTSGSTWVPQITGWSGNTHGQIGIGSDFGNYSQGASQATAPLHIFNDAVATDTNLGFVQQKFEMYSADTDCQKIYLDFIIRDGNETVLPQARISVQSGDCIGTQSQWDEAKGTIMFHTQSGNGNTYIQNYGGITPSTDTLEYGGDESLLERMRIGYDGNVGIGTQGFALNRLVATGVYDETTITDQGSGYVTITQTGTTLTVSGTPPIAMATLVGTPPGSNYTIMYEDFTTATFLSSSSATSATMSVSKEISSAQTFKLMKETCYLDASNDAIIHGRNTSWNASMVGMTMQFSNRAYHNPTYARISTFTSSTQLTMDRDCAYTGVDKTAWSDTERQSYKITQTGFNVRDNGAGNPVTVGINTLTPTSTFEIVGDTLMSGASRYLNFGTVSGTSGYGVRNNAGTMDSLKIQEEAGLV